MTSYRKQAIIALLILLNYITSALANEQISLHLASTEVKSLNGKVEYQILKNNKITVLILNKSNKPLKIWDDDNSWGYYALSFKVKSKEGKESLIKPKLAFFTANIPTYRVIETGELA